MVKTKKKNYWTKEQEDAIRLYLSMDPYDEKAEKLFREKLFTPLQTLVEGLMLSYHLAIPGIPIEEQIQDALGFVILKMRMLNSEAKTKAFSYYGTIAKNYMILKKNREYKKTKATSSIDDIDGYEIENELFENNHHEEKLLSKEYAIDFLANEIEKKMETDLDMDVNVYKVGEVVVYLLRNYVGINVFNKNQFYFIAKEFTGLKTKEVTKALKSIKEMFDDVGLELYS